MNTLKIRKAEQGDMEQIINLCQLHSEYEGQPYNRKGKLQMLSNAIFNKNILLWCYVAENDGVIEGYATATKEFSTWDAQHYLHMDCLFVLETSRGKSIGKKLLKTIEELSTEQLCTHVQWQTPINNKGAINFYERYGAISKPKLRFFLEKLNKVSL